MYKRKEGMFSRPRFLKKINGGWSGLDYRCRICHCLMEFEAWSHTGDGGYLRDH